MKSQMEYRSSALKVNARAAAIAARLKELAPYALMELVLPGGSVMAVLLWLYRRKRNALAPATKEIAAVI
jgi:hypothetical protein